MSMYTVVRPGETHRNERRPLEAQLGQNRSTNVDTGLSDYKNHKRPELVSFDDIDYEKLSDVQDARTSMLREQWIRSYALRVTHDALKKCKQYHGVDAQKNCRPLVLKYMKMLESYPMQGYLGYQKNDPSQ